MSKNKKSITLEEAKKKFHEYYDTKISSDIGRFRAKLFDMMYQKKPEFTLKPNDPDSYRYLSEHGPKTFDMVGVDAFPEGEEFTLTDPKGNKRTYKSKGASISKKPSENKLYGPRLNRKSDGELYSEYFSKQYKNKYPNDPSSLIKQYWSNYKKFHENPQSFNLTKKGKKAKLSYNRKKKSSKTSNDSPEALELPQSSKTYESSKTSESTELPESIQSPVKADSIQSPEVSEPVESPKLSQTSKNIPFDSELSPVSDDVNYNAMLEFTDRSSDKLIKVKLDDIKNNLSDENLDYLEILGIINTENEDSDVLVIPFEECELFKINISDEEYVYLNILDKKVYDKNLNNPIDLDEFLNKNYLDLEDLFEEEKIKFISNKELSLKNNILPVKKTSITSTNNISSSTSISPKKTLTSPKKSSSKNVIPDKENISSTPIISSPSESIDSEESSSKKQVESGQKDDIEENIFMGLNNMNPDDDSESESGISDTDSTSDSIFATNLKDKFENVVEKTTSSNKSETSNETDDQLMSENESLGAAPETSDEEESEDEDSSSRYINEEGESEEESEGESEEESEEESDEESEEESDEESIYNKIKISPKNPVDDGDILKLEKTEKNLNKELVRLVKKDDVGYLLKSLKTNNSSWVSPEKFNSIIDGNKYTKKNIFKKNTLKDLSDLSQDEDEDVDEDDEYSNNNSLSKFLDNDDELIEEDKSTIDVQDENQSISIDDIEKLMDDEDEFEIEDDKYKLAYKHDGKKFYYLESEENDTPLLYIEDEGDLKHVGDWDLRKKQAIFEDIDEAKENNWIIN